METPNSVTAGQTDTGPDRILSGLLDYFLKNPLLVLWNAALVLGGLTCFSHFTAIRYFPDLDFKTASSFLVGVALLGVAMMSMLAAMLVVPSYLIRTEVWKPYLVLQAVSMSEEGTQGADPRSGRRLLPFTTVSLLHGLTALSFWILVASFFIDDAFLAYGQRLRYVSGIALTLWIGVLVWLNYRWKRQGVHGDARAARWPALERKERRISLTIWIVVFPGILLLLILSAGRLDSEDLAGHLYVAGFAVGFIMANIGLAATDFSSTQSYWKIPVVAAFLVIFYLNIPSNPLSLTRTISVSLAIGDLNATRLVVKRPTCDALNLIVPKACSVASEALGCVWPSSLANRIGNEYLLVFKAPAGNAEIRVPIPKAEVLVWATSDSDAALREACNMTSGSSSQPAMQEPSARP